MHIREFRPLLEKRAKKAGFEFHLAGPALDSALSALEERVGQAIPRGVEFFYRSHDGLEVRNPPLVILPLAHLVRTRDHVHVATVGEGHRLGFAVGARNAANEWDILSMETGHLVTMTMASFWSNKVWAWLLKGRAIWAPGPFDPPASCR